MVEKGARNLMLQIVLEAMQAILQPLSDFVRPEWLENIHARKLQFHTAFFRGAVIFQKKEKMFREMHGGTTYRCFRGSTSKHWNPDFDAGVTRSALKMYRFAEW